MKTLISSLILSAAIPLSAVAAGPWAAFNVGYGTYSMSDLNDEIGLINDAAGGDYIDEVNGGLILGLNEDIN